MPLPPSNINDPIRNDYHYHPYTDHIGKEDDPKKLFDLGKLDFSIEDFQKLASGKYNAGHLTLDKKGRLDIVNNHKTWTIFNSVKVGAAESFAIRMAFAEALENAGVSDAKMDAVRQRLGLKPDSSFGSGHAITPLTRQEVREIIDANIGEINDGRADGKKLRTEDQIHARENERDRTERMNVRNALAAEAKHLRVDIEDDLAYTIDFLVRRDYSKCTEGELRVMLAYAEDLKDALLSLEDEETNDAWRGENGSLTRFERLSHALSVAIDEDNHVIIKTMEKDRELTFSLGMSAGELIERIEGASKRINRTLEKKEGTEPTPLSNIASGSATDALAPVFDGFKEKVRQTDANTSLSKVFRGKMVATAKAELASGLAQQIGEHFDPDAEDTIFRNDIHRGLDLTLGGEKLPRDFHAAREKVLRFATGDTNLTWANATREQKVRANILMALCNQSLNSIPGTALSDALSTRPDENAPPVSFIENGEPGKGHTARVVVTKNAAGDITVGLRQAKFVNNVSLELPNGETEDVDLDEGSHLDYELDVTIPKANLDKLSSADWTQYDHKPVHDATHGENNTANGRLNAASLVPADYKLEPKVRIKISAHLDAPGNTTIDPNPPNTAPAQPEPPKANAEPPKQEKLFVPEPPANGPRPVPPAPPRNVPGPVPDIPVKADVPKADGPKAGGPKVDGPRMEGSQVVNGLPKITSQAEFDSFVKRLSVDSQYGAVEEAGTAPDVKGDEKKVFVYKGLVFRCASRPPSDPSLADGFHSKNDLSVPRHRTEAMGLGIGIDDGHGGTKYTGWGFTGESGVSTAKSLDGAISYRHDRCTFYVIDTTKLPEGESAWDMESARYGNGYDEKALDADGNPIDETKGEVNLSRIPRNAIVGWVTVRRGQAFGDIQDNAERLRFLQTDPTCEIQFNPDYKA